MTENKDNDKRIYQVAKEFTVTVQKVEQIAGWQERISGGVVLISAVLTIVCLFGAMICEPAYCSVTSYVDPPSWCSNSYLTTLVHVGGYNVSIFTAWFAVFFLMGMTFITITFLMNMLFPPKCGAVIELHDGSHNYPLKSCRVRFSSDSAMDALAVHSAVAKYRMLAEEKQREIDAVEDPKQKKRELCEARFSAVMDLVDTGKKGE